MAWITDICRSNDSTDFPASQVTYQNLESRNLAENKRECWSVTHEEGKKSWTKSNKFDCNLFEQYLS